LERELAIANNSYHGGGDDRVPAITVVVDVGWSKRSHQHSYNANSGIGVTYLRCSHQRAALHWSKEQVYCSICAVSKGIPAPEYKCYCNWSSSSCIMEADIILEGFLQSESIDGLRYCWMIGDGDSFVYNNIVTRCTTRDVIKVKCADHAVKCYRNRLEHLWNDKPPYRGFSPDEENDSWSTTVCNQGTYTAELVMSMLFAITSEMVLAITLGYMISVALHSAAINHHLVIQQVI